MKRTRLLYAVACTFAIALALLSTPKFAKATGGTEPKMCGSIFCPGGSLGCCWDGTGKIYAKSM